MSRLEKMRAEFADDRYMPAMPPVECGAYLVGYLYEVGPTVAAGMGAGPVTHTELDAWQRGIGLSLAPWEFRYLRRLSIEYLTESRLAEEEKRAAPWIDPDSDEYKTDVLPKKIRSMLRE